MILYLLFPGLILGVVESLIANVTLEELSQAERNRTISTTKPENLSISLFKDENEVLMSQIEEELQNKTSAVITEDDERFQNKVIHFSARRCHQDLLKEFSHSICGAAFHTEMLSISSDKWCVLENIIGTVPRRSSCLWTLLRDW
ncbi:uncharacterized protein [Antennarius striatus]|uniref:uncharacterized protein isoform X2 n=1 Tax=Antennarius striatus TaxID=241820 RepID=UPI0035B2F082